MDDKIEFDINRNRAEEMASVVTMLLQERGELSLVKVQDCVITTVEHRLPQYIAEEREACCKAGPTYRRSCFSSSAHGGDMRYSASTKQLSTTVWLKLSSETEGRRKIGRELRKTE